MLVVHAYLKAEQPIRDIVDTALRPYMQKDADFCVFSHNAG